MLTWHSICLLDALLVICLGYRRQTVLGDMKSVSVLGLLPDFYLCHDHGLEEFVPEACREGLMCMGSVVDVSVSGVLQHSSVPPNPLLSPNLGATVCIVSSLSSQIALFSSSKYFHRCI